MTTIKTTVYNRRIEVPAPGDIPDGTEVLLRIEDCRAADDGPLSPEEIASTLAAMDNIEPLDWTAEERAAWEADRKARKAWEKARFEEHAEQLRRVWE